MKKVLIAIRPKWCEKIVSGEKTIEVRKTAPKEVPFKAYIYETKKEHLRVVFKKGDYIFSDDHSAGKFDENIFVKDRYSWQGKVIGEFICDKIDKYKFHEGLTEFNSMGLPSRIYGSYLIFADDYKSMCLSYDEVKNYGKGKTLYGLHIKDLKIYDKPRELSEFFIPCKGQGCSRCDWEREYDVCACAYKKPITRAPQSWQYVEDLGEVK